MSHMTSRQCGAILNIYVFKIWLNRHLFVHVHVCTCIYVCRSAPWFYQDILHALYCPSSCIVLVPVTPILGIFLLISNRLTGVNSRLSGLLDMWYSKRQVPSAWVVYHAPPSMPLSLTWWLWPCMWHLREAQCCSRYHCALAFICSTRVQNAAKETDLAEQVNCPEGSCLLEEEWNLVQAPHCHTSALITELTYTLCSSPQSTSSPAGTLGEGQCNCCPLSQLHPFLSASSVPRKSPWDKDPRDMVVSEDLSVCPCPADRCSGQQREQVTIPTGPMRVLCGAVDTRCLPKSGRLVSFPQSKFLNPSSALNQAAQNNYCSSMFLKWG